MKTTYSKGKANSMSEADANGKAWQINTWKNDRGFVVCSAVQGTLREGLFSYELFGAKRLTLANEQGIATEKRIQSVHEKGLAEFERIMAEEQATKGPVYVITVGQVFFSDFNGRTRDRVVYAIKSPGQFSTVLLDGSGFEQDERVRDYREKHGIGTYNNEGEVITQEEVDELVAKATEVTEKKAREEAQAKADQENDRIEKIAIGSQILPAIPFGAVAIIVGRLEENTSDPMSDYFGSRTVKTVYLAFSRHTKDVFAEMRQAAGLYEETKHLQTAGPEAEHREKYSMGAGYYLSTGNRYSGWQVSKDTIGKYTSLENLQIAAAEGRFLCPTMEAQDPGSPVEGTTVRLNPAKRGIEIYFAGKPGAQVLADLKANGWRWAFHNKCWYTKDSSSARRFAKQYGFEEADLGAEMVTANENAGIDRWAANNL